MGGKGFQGTTETTPALLNIDASLMAASQNEKHPDVGPGFASFARQIMAAPSREEAAKRVIAAWNRLNNPDHPKYAESVKEASPQMKALVDEMAAQVQAGETGWFERLTAKIQGRTPKAPPPSIPRPLSGGVRG